MILHTYREAQRDMSLVFAFDNKSMHVITAGLYVLLHSKSSYVHVHRGKKYKIPSITN